MPKAAQSPMRLSLNAFRKLGCLCGITERRISIPGGGSFLKDLFGVVDFLAIAGKDLIAVQCTSDINHNARVKKAMALPEVKQWLHPESNRKLLIVTWKKVGSRWVNRGTQISLHQGKLKTSGFYLK